MREVANSSVWEEETAEQVDQGAGESQRSFGAHLHMLDYSVVLVQSYAG